VELPLPFTKAELFDGYAKWADEELARRGGRPSGKASASGIGSCARKQAALLAGVPTGGGAEMRADGVVTTEQGRMTEDLTCGAIEAMPYGLTVVNRQLCIGHPKCHPDNEQGPLNYVMSGHPDGELARIEHMPDGTWGTNPLLADGRKWGFEHKHIGRYGYKKILEQGFMQAEPVYMAQTVTYGDALDWDAVLVVVMAQDASSTTFEIRNAAKQGRTWATLPTTDPKILMFAYDLKAMRPLAAPLKARAQDIMTIAAFGKPEDVAAEYDGKRVFPCGYCPVQGWCQQHPGGSAVTQSPFGLET
jgi:hypothetical protein